MTVIASTKGTTDTIQAIKFPGGEPHVPSSTPVWRQDKYVIDARVSSFNDIGEILVINDYLRRNGATQVDLFIPYFPGARQDRGTPLTVKVYADIINAAGFDRVAIVDPHSDVAPALIDRCDVISITEVFSPMLHGVSWDPLKHVLIVPDVGASKRVEAVASRYGYQTVQAGKRRDFATGALSDFWCDPIPDGMAGIVVDDICDGGGTFIGLADVIPRTTQLHLWVTHGIFSKGMTEILRQYDTVRTTDSFPAYRDYGPLSPDVRPLTDVLDKWRKYR